MNAARVDFESPIAGALSPAQQAEADAAAKAQQQPNQTQQTQTPPAAPAAPERPAWLPEKFKDAEAMANAYKALEQKLGKPAEVKPETPPADPNAKPPTPEEKAAADKVAAEKAQSDKAAAEKTVGAEDLEAFNKEFSEKGALSEDSYAKLQAKGIPKHMVDAYIAGQQALGQQTLNEFYALAGGSKESYAEMAQWAVQNLSEGEIAAYNKATGDGGDAGVAKLAIQGLYTRFSQNQPPRNISARQSSAAHSNVKPFASTEEMTSAMQDARYSSDPGYREEVAARVAAM